MAFSWIGGVEPATALLGWRSLGLAILAALALFFTRLYQERMQFRRTLRQYDIPTLSHSLLFGHLIHLGKALAPLPRDFSKMGLPYALLKAYPEICEPGIVYIDSWPFGGAMACVFHPLLMSQFTQERSLPKAPLVLRELQPLTGLRDLVTMEGRDWKFWRAVFNPGFSAKNLTAMVPGFLEEIQVLKERLEKAAATGEIVVMEKTVQTATVDVICRAALGVRLHSQNRDSEFLTALTDQIWWLTCDYSLANRLKEIFPLRPFFLWNNSRRMKNFLAPLIEAEVTKSDSDQDTGYKTINSLAIKAYRAERDQHQSTRSSSKSMANQIDPEFLETAIAQLKVFIFAGHDTTASTISFAYSLLYQHPRVLAACRAEHTAILGPRPSDALARLTANPNLLHQLPYTLAVLKETLRLNPPAATVRVGDPNVHLVHPATGKTYPTKGFFVWGASWLTHRHPDYWPRADEFVPERWLVPSATGEEEADGLHPRKHAWRPFELGPRNCIGQELALLELRAILAMTLRELDLEPVYGEDAARAVGERAYQVMGVGDITGHIKDGFPVRVRARSVAEIAADSAKA